MAVLWTPWSRFRFRILLRTATLGKGSRTMAATMHQFHSNKANPPDSRYTVSYIKYHPSYVPSMASHTRVHALLSFRIALNGVWNLFFYAQSTLRRRQGDKASTDNPLNDPFFEAVDRPGPPTSGGRPLF
jgi:hypothetical protein